MKLQTLTGVGYSGWPFISNGARLGAERVSPDAYRPGDLAVFCGAGVYVCHRVLSVKVEDGLHWFYMRGDAKLEADGWVPAYRMIGRIREVDGKPLASGLLSSLIVSYLRLQSALYENLFLSPFGIRLRSVREFFWPRPIFIGLFHKLSAPWLIVQPSKSR